MPADVTPGSWRTRSSTASTNCVRFAGSAYVRRGRLVRIVRTCAGSKPSGTARTARRLCTSSPAAISTAVASAISVTTSALRNRVPAPRTPRLDRVTDIAVSTREARHAGAMPKSRPVSTARAVVTPSTRGSSVDMTEPAERPRNQQRQQAERLRRDDDAEDAAGDGEQQALRQQLAHEAAPIRAERRADGHLARAAGGVRQHEIGDVDARDEQDAPDRDDERDERRSRVADVVVEQRHGVHADAVVGLRMLDLQSLGQRLQLRVGERERRVRTEARRRRR